MNNPANTKKNRIIRFQTGLAESGQTTFNGLRNTRGLDSAATIFISVLGWTAIFVLIGIAAFLIQSSLRAFDEVGIWSMIAGSGWFPTSSNARYGFLPAQVGSIWVTTVALSACVPIGVLSAVYLSEFASKRFREAAKTVIEFMVTIPSVVFGLIGLAVLVPLIRQHLPVDSGLVALTAGLVVGIVCLPTIISISEDALRSVPSELRQGSFALGNTRWQTAYKVILPAASSGVFAAVMLGMGRAIGETMVVLMLAGNAGIIPASPLEAARTMTGTIAQETGEVVRGSVHFSVLFTLGLVLFVITFAINLFADMILERSRKKWRR
ncbi:MAG: phosphate ABC transporter permease subunit PstC [Coriobacteriia bacterium]|nr:phosphate ABC transporter permease subunit PstC [Coriobacteriia bacterium]MCL2537071.1 phosphate ABC transporter permease subunit PstC [Coriobacteriia bacterium]